VECFYGYRFIRITMFFAGFLLLGFMTLLVVSLSFRDLPVVASFFIVLGIGLGGGLLCLLMWEPAILMIGAYGGFALAYALLSVARIENHTTAAIILGIFMLAGVIGVKLAERHAIIILTSFGGAFAFVWGVDDFAHTGFQNILTVISAVGQFYFVPDWRTYTLGAVWLVLTAAGTAWEYWRHEEMILKPGKWGCDCAGNDAKEDSAAPGNTATANSSAAEKGGWVKGWKDAIWRNTGT